jgi:hypothetical protein
MASREVWSDALALAKLRSLIGHLIDERVKRFGVSRRAAYADLARELEQLDLEEETNERER